MPEIDSPRPEEFGSDINYKDQVHLEFATRPFELGPLNVFGDYEAGLDRLLQGDLNSHSWNIDVARRIKKYNPIGLMLDSHEGAVNFYKKFNYDLKYASQVLTWYDLPARPKNVSNITPLYVFRQDTLLTNVLAAIPLDSPVFKIF